MALLALDLAAQNVGAALDSPACPATEHWPEQETGAKDWCGAGLYRITEAYRPDWLFLLFILIINSSK